MDSKLHPAMTVSNIKNLVPITLEADAAHYTTWAELSQNSCKAYQVYDHLQPRKKIPASASSSEADKAKDATPPEPSPDDEALWSRLDAIVKQWIYGTISTDLLHTILTPGQTAYDAWTILANLFQDNKNTRSVFLRQEFSNVRLENFPNMSAYCQQVKLLSDQLTSVGAPVDNQRLVLQLLTGLTEQYDGISTILQHRDPLPDFNEARSHLTMEESKKKHQVAQAAHSSATALAAVTTSPSPSDNNANPPSDRNRGWGRSRGRGRGRGPNGRGGRGYNAKHPYIVFPQGWASNQWAGLMNNQA
ncbi:uncharacterized protein LOC118485045 [Helianthus annuus]|uniref:uncharacterized protein LOC118485045 n=1 Tax=Helianthus annuus TaxID=4232 RepID=UPI001652F439|nr:uncharacterized protein LOC118485045 [Helianthus annuus]